MKSENAHSAYGIVMRPHISEKSVANTDRGKYVFEVMPGATKQEIRKSIEDVYKVKVEKVNKIKTPSKTSRYRFQQGFKTRNDKAVVTLKKGQEIEVLPQ